jgi:hypothetical protein
MGTLNARTVETTVRSVTECESWVQDVETVLKAMLSSKAQTIFEADEEPADAKATRLANLRRVKGMNIRLSDFQCGSRREGPISRTTSQIRLSADQAVRMIQLTIGPISQRLRCGGCPDNWICWELRQLWDDVAQRRLEQEAELYSLDVRSEENGFDQERAGWDAEYADQMFDIAMEEEDAFRTYTARVMAHERFEEVHGVVQIAAHATAGLRPGWFQVEIQNLVGDAVKLLVMPHATVLQIKRVVAQAEGTPVFQQSLWAEGAEEEMQNKCTAAESGLGWTNTLFLVKGVELDSCESEGETRPGGRAPGRFVQEMKNQWENERLEMSRMSQRLGMGPVWF